MSTADCTLHASSNYNATMYGEAGARRHVYFNPNACIQYSPDRVERGQWYYTHAV